MSTMTREELELRVAEVELRLKERELRRPMWRQSLIAIFTVVVSILGSGLTTYLVGKSEERAASAAIINDVFDSDDLATSFRKLKVMMAAGLLPNSERLEAVLDTLRPLVARSYIDKGRQLESDSKLYEAASAFQEAVEIGNDAQSRFYLGATLLKIGDRDHSVPVRERALKNLGIAGTEPERSSHDLLAGTSVPQSRADR